MKKLLVTIVAPVGFMMAGSALATEMPAAAKAKCGACHTIDAKLVGPAWKDVAKKYKGDAKAASKIAANITAGGSFGWNLGKMPARGLGASDADIKSLAKFIAGLK